MNGENLTWAILAVALVTTLIGLIVARRRRVYLRPIAAYTALPLLAADAVEGAKRLHFSMGSSAVGSTSTVAALASAGVIYQMAKRLAVSPRTPLVTLSDPVTLALAQDTLRRAYVYRQTMPYFRPSAAAWFPHGDRSLVFAAGAASLANDADVSSSVLLGRFGAEMALLGEGALRRDQGMVAHSDYLEGQAIAFVQANDVLLGEELYAGAAYLSGRPVEQGSVLALDVLRWLVILGILAYALQTAL